MSIAEPDYAAEMRLPEGKTCADCVHIKRCDAFGFSAPALTSCDFWPSKYCPAAASVLFAEELETVKQGENQR